MPKVVSSLFACMLVFLAACSATDEKTDQDHSSSEQTKEEKEEMTETIYSLTGMPTEEAMRQQRATAVMVNNHPKARPQAGLSQADIVFEILAEGSITRFLALYQSEQPDVVGPVRSAREYFFNLADGYDALYIYHGAADFIDDKIDKQGIAYLNGALHDDDGVLFKRSSSRSAPHNSYLQFDNVYDAAEQKEYDMTQAAQPMAFMTEDEAADLTGDEASRVTIDYSKAVGAMDNVVTYTYDEADEVYTRYSDNEQTMDAHAEEPVTVSNLFIIETPHSVIDDAGRRDIDITSGGNGYLIQKGNIRKVQWENRDGRIIPVQDGDPVAFVPGQTWINVVPADPGMSQSVTVANE